MASVRARRWLRRGSAVALVLIVALVVASTWYYSTQIDQLLLASSRERPAYDVEVVAVGEEAVTLADGPRAERPGTWGLEWATGYARIGPVAEVTTEGVRRPLLALAGRLRPGTKVSLDPLVYEADPSDAGVDYENVIVEGPLGNYPAWRTAGDNDCWVIIVHGRGTTRREGLRVLPALAAAGFPTLTITYRNDPDGPEGGGRYGLGNPEWEDLQAAVEYALDEGANGVILMGYGMGGTIAAVFLHQSAEAAAVRGLVLDAPLLDAGAVVDADARSHNVPGPIAGLAKSLATLRFGVDWGALDQLNRVGDFEVPILLFHGTADTEAPVEVSDRFADSLGRTLRYIRVEGAGPGECWNADPPGYEAALTTFVLEVAGEAAEG